MRLDTIVIFYISNSDFCNNIRNIEAGICAIFSLNIMSSFVTTIYLNLTFYIICYVK